MICTTQALGSLKKNKVWVSFSPWIIVYSTDFFINLQMATEWKFAFLNTAMIIFCILLLQYSSQYPKCIIFSCWPLRIYFFKIHNLATFHHTVVVVMFWKNSFNISFRGSDFTIVTGDGNTNYIALFIVSRLSNQIHLSISGLLIVMGKPVRKAYLGIVKHDWTSIVC